MQGFKLEVFRRAVPVDTVRMVYLLFFSCKRLWYTAPVAPFLVWKNLLPHAQVVQGFRVDSGPGPGMRGAG